MFGGMGNLQGGGAIVQSIIDLQGCFSCLFLDLHSHAWLAKIVEMLLMLIMKRIRVAEVARIVFAENFGLGQKF